MMKLDGQEVRLVGIPRWQHILIQTTMAVVGLGTFVVFFGTIAEAFGGGHDLFAWLAVASLFFTSRTQYCIYSALLAIAIITGATTLLVWMAVGAGLWLVGASLTWYARRHAQLIAPPVIAPTLTEPSKSHTPPRPKSSRKPLPMLPW